MVEASLPAKALVAVPPSVASARPLNALSAAKFRLAVMWGNCAPTHALAPVPAAAIAPDNTGDPRSNSWLPKAAALVPKAFMMAMSERASAVVPIPGTLLRDGSEPPTSHGPGM